MTGALEPATMYPKLRRIAEMAREQPDLRFHALNSYLTTELLQEAYQRTRKGGATGVDGQTAQDYAADLEGNLRRLLERAKSGTYRAPPVRRVHIPKGTSGETRPLGIPTFEDKVLQRSVAMILEAIYEQDFHPGSFGFRAGRGARQALQAVWKGLMDGGGWVVEVDIRKFFDSVDRDHLMEILRRRVNDGVILRLVSKWLHAGVQEAGVLSYPEEGTPQGGVISPLLANIFLNEVLDWWWEREVKPRLSAAAHLVRYADDFVLVFQDEADARRVMAVLPKRFGKYGLTLHPTKTRLVRFGRPHGDDDPPPGEGSFDFLGFTHVWVRSLRGRWVVRQKTARTRLARGMRAVREWGRKHRHLPLAGQWKALKAKLRGHYGYFGITGNYRSLTKYHGFVLRVWRRWLSRRSQRAYLSWEKYLRILRRFPLPPPRLRSATP